VADSPLIGLIAAVAMAALIAMRVAARERHLRTLSRLEAKLDALLKHQGIQFNPYADAPAAVVDALRRGKKIEAIKEYRAATGAGLKDAKDYVDELERRTAARP
jgi:ribosomal protein L7/L12